MRNVFLAGVAVITLVASAWQVGQVQAQNKISEFKMTVELTGGGLIAQCTEGCAWKELTYGCSDPKQPCRVAIDQRGLAGK